ncbi:YqfQ family protein [Bacillus xiapuensis]|uniref:YqfQ family protein n=1 Tax=Bacillus xiapuensis TaxID=2014075 RepID=UPI001E51EF6E|nr:YqfQ family protein [Bacillus xiapuensis]
MTPMAPRRSGQGLLGRLLQGSRGGNMPMTGFERQGASAAGSAAQKLSNPANFQQILSNTQQFLNTVQQVGPLVEQYGPLVKNLPSMWKLYRGLKSLPDQEEESSKEEKDQAAKPKSTKNDPPTLPESTSDGAKKKKEEDSEEMPERSNHNGRSTPKLYV